MTHTSSHDPAGNMLTIMRRMLQDDWNVAVPTGVPREIASGIYWLSSCVRRGSGENEIHGGMSAYLVVGATKSILVDTGGIYGWSVADDQLSTPEQVAMCLGDRRLDYVMPTHPEVPHSGKLDSLLDRYPDALAVGDMRDFHLYFPEHADRFIEMPVGDVLDLGGGYRFHVIEAVLKDLPNTRWGYEEKQRVMFVSDGFAYLHHPELGEDAVGLHLPGECGRIASYGDLFPTVESILYYSRAAFYWTQFRTDTDTYLDQFQDLLQRYPSRMLAPSHGNVIADVDRVVQSTRQAYGLAYDA